MTDRQTDNIICIPFAFKKDACTGVNVFGDAYSTYLKNACVALCSAKFYNPKAEVCLATNLNQHTLPKEYTELLFNAGITIIYIPFDSFVFPDDYTWSLAFYKLCVLKHLTLKGYKNICYMDTDVYVQGEFDNIWKECEQNILLYDINHGLGVNDYKIICDEFESFLGDQRLITHYGGEFFAASSDNAEIFCKHAEYIYNRMIENSFQTTKGDEFILSLAADKMRSKIKNAGAYIFRFWTGTFRLVSTCYEYNRITILHMPSEKEYGNIKLYDKYIKRGRIPSDNQVWKTCRLRSLDMITKTKRIILKCLRR